MPDEAVVESERAKNRPSSLGTTGSRVSVAGSDATRYVGSLAVATSAAAAAGIPSVGPRDSELNQQRRRFVWSCVVAFLVSWFIAFLRFFLPRVLFGPATAFEIGYPFDCGVGIDERWLQKYRIWVDRTLDWKPAENKFKYPSHGGGYDSERINFEGPAPRPMDRAEVQIGADGQIVVDVARLYS